MDLKNKVALITGASSGIGAATARKLAAQGIRVGLAARRTDRLAVLRHEIQAAGGDALVIEMDVANEASVAAGVESLVKAYGSVDIVFNNAGLMPLSTLHELKIDEWNRMIDVNIRGVLHGIAAVLPGMRARKSGHIINLSSIGGHQVWPTCAVTVARSSPSSPFRRGSAWRTPTCVSPSSRPELGTRRHYFRPQRPRGRQSQL
jgi:NADP-dependent 3-hydroxy acid dehydrogenase YdfG